MSRQTFPNMSDQPLCTFHTFRITGASVGATAGSAGLDGRGKFLCTISQAANVFTITWTPTFADIPYVFFQPDAGQADTSVEILTLTATGMTFTAYTSDDSGTPIVNPDLQVFVASYGTTAFMS